MKNVIDVKEYENMSIVNKDKIENVVLETGVSGLMAFPFTCAATVAVGVVAPSYAIPALVVMQSVLMAAAAENSISRQRKK